MLERLSARPGALLGRWAVTVPAGIITTLVFLLWVPRQVAVVTDHGHRGS